MKHLNWSTLMLVVLGGVFLVAGKGKEKIPKGETEVVVPCSGPDFFTTNKFFRANSIGESQDQVTSKKKALANARRLMVMMPEPGRRKTRAVDDLRRPVP